MLKTERQRLKDRQLLSLTPRWEQTFIALLLHAVFFLIWSNFYSTNLLSLYNILNAYTFFFRFSIQVMYFRCPLVYTGRISCLEIHHEHAAKLTHPATLHYYLLPSLAHFLRSQPFNNQKGGRVFSERVLCFEEQDLLLVDSKNWQKGILRRGNTMASARLLLF